MSSRRKRTRLERTLAAGRKRRKAVRSGVPRPKPQAVVHAPRDLGARETSRRLRGTARRKKRAVGNGVPKLRPPAVVYSLREDPIAKPTYVGITNKPPRRAGEHRAAGKPGDLYVETPKLPRKVARALERQRQEELGLRRPPRDHGFRVRRGS